jgi:hypothetical protein
MVATSTDAAIASAARMIAEGRATFRFETFGDEAFWGGQLLLHRALARMTPNQALALGLKIDAGAPSGTIVADIRSGKASLDDPATLTALLRSNAVVGLTGFSQDGASPPAALSATSTLASIGVQCALCHSTVDDSFGHGIGSRLDATPNRDLDVGGLIALAPNLAPLAEGLGGDVATVRSALLSWGRGKFDAQLFLDGKAAGPLATLIPPLFGRAGVPLATSTGWGSTAYWSALEASVVMQGRGSFFDPRLDDASRFPIASARGLGHLMSANDRVTPKLASLHLYLLAIEAPPPPSSSFDPASRERGAALFMGAARCASCHVPPLFTEPGFGVHTPSEIGIDDFQSSRSPAQGYRTTPLKGLWARAKGGYYHDGRFGTLAEVIDHYDAVYALGLGAGDKSDLVQYLLSL